jgi:hypothetical protein
VVTGNYRDLLIAFAECSATLTGLLFVALSVAPRHPSNTHLGVVQQIRAAASFLAFTGALAVSIFGLVPGNNIGYPAAVVGVIGIAFTAASLRSILLSTTSRHLVRRQLGLIVVLLLTFGVELAGGLVLITNQRSVDGLDLISNVLGASLLIGVARAWELVEDRDVGFISSIALLSGRSLARRHGSDADRKPGDHVEESAATDGRRLDKG